MSPTASCSSGSSRTHSDSRRSGGSRADLARLQQHPQRHLGLVDFLLDATPETDPRREDIEEIQRAAERAAGLTRQLVAFSRRQILRPELVDVNETVRSMDRMLSRIFGPEVRLETRSATGNAGSRSTRAARAGDREPGGQRARRDAGRRAGDVRDGARGAGRRLRRGSRSVVSDTGHGMDESIQERIFEPFFTTKEPDKGTGLGLASVYGIVQQSGGTVTVTSSPSSGPTFRVLLPAAAPAREVAAAAAAPGLQPIEGIRILLVEDNDDVRRATTRVLERIGHTVIVVADGIEALERFDQPERFDLVVTDVLMPRLGGIELVERLACHRSAASRRVHLGVSRFRVGRVDRHRRTHRVPPEAVRARTSSPMRSPTWPRSSPLGGMASASRSARPLGRDARCASVARRRP